MKKQNYTTSFLVDNTPQEVYDAVNNVRGWWTENTTGETTKTGDEFSVRFWDVHYSKQLIVEAIPGKKVVWLVTDSRLSFLEDQQEWTGMKITFEIFSQGKQTRLQFTQEGLSPDVECFNDCSDAWNGYVNGSLRSLITSGEGKPEKLETEDVQQTK